MEVASFFLLAFLCGLASTSPVYDDGKFYFENSGGTIDEPAPAIMIRGEATDADAIQEQGSWLQKYHHVRMPNNKFSAPQYELENPEELRWLIENLLARQQEPRANPLPQYSPKTSNKNLNSLKFDSMYKDSSPNNGDDFDYMDVYNEHQELPQTAENEENFQQELKDYMFQGPKGEMPKDQLQSNRPKEHQSIEEKLSEKYITISSSTMAPALSIPEETPSSAAPVVLTSESSAPLDVIPPVAVGKGQKEYPMFRPATENRRKFDRWAESLQQSMVQELNGIRSLRSVADHKQEQDYPVDSVAEELNELKIQSQRAANNPVWF